MSSSSDKYSGKPCEQRKANGDPCNSPALNGKRFCHCHDKMEPIAHQHRQRRNHSLLSRLPPSTSGCRLHPVRNLRSLRDAAPPHRAKRSFSPVLRHTGRILEFGPQKSKGKYRDATGNDSGMGAAATSQSPPAGLITRGRTMATMPPRSSPCAPPTTASRA